MKNAKPMQYQNTPYLAPRVPAWLKTAVVPLVKLNLVYQLILARTFKLFELLAKPFFAIANSMDRMAQKPGSFIGVLLLVAVAMMVYKSGLH